MSNVIRVGSAPSLKLPDLTNPAKAEEIATGKEAIGSNGEIIVGTRSSVATSEWLPLFTTQSTTNSISTRVTENIYVEFSIVFKTIPKVLLFKQQYSQHEYYSAVYFEDNGIWKLNYSNFLYISSESMENNVFSGFLGIQGNDESLVWYLAIY